MAGLIFGTSSPTSTFTSPILSGVMVTVYFCADTLLKFDAVPFCDLDERFVVESKQPMEDAGLVVGELLEPLGRLARRRGQDDFMVLLVVDLGDTATV